jgi:hypothetical protein
VNDDDHLGPGYRLQAPAEAPVREPSRAPALDMSARPEGYLVRRKPISLDDGLLAPRDVAETSLFGSLLYPLRAAESLGVIGVLSLVWWIMLTLVSEYCFTLMGDAEMLGASLMGKLLLLLTILPVAFLFPFSFLYCLQYLGRVLVASAMGETHPPRTPDRNFDGFFTGMSPWLIWLTLGVAVGLLPAAVYFQLSTSTGLAHVLTVVALGLAGIPYMLMALMMTFVHDHPLAATPFKVFGALLKLGGSFLLLCLFVVSAMLLLIPIVALLLVVRNYLFWIYLLLAIGGWAALNWLLIAVMRAIGNYYHHHKDSLRWNREHPRWGVRWRL